MDPIRVQLESDKVRLSANSDGVQSDSKIYTPATSLWSRAVKIKTDVQHFPNINYKLLSSCCCTHLDGYPYLDTYITIFEAIKQRKIHTVPENVIAYL